MKNPSVTSLKMNFQNTWMPILCFLLMGQVLFAQNPFNNHATIIESQLSNRSWHITVQSSDKFIGTVNGDVAELSNWNINNASTWIVDDGPNDGKWWTADKRYFGIKSVDNGKYITLLGEYDGAVVGLLDVYGGSSNLSDRQLFELVPAPAASGWYRLKSKVGNYILEVSSNGQLHLSSNPITATNKQKFGFNLALPNNANNVYIIIGKNNSHFISDLGNSASVVPAKHIEDSDNSIMWQFLPDGNGYYGIRNILTGHYLSSNGSTSAGDELYGTYGTSDSEKWQLQRNEITFEIVNKASGYRIGTLGQTATDKPIYQTTATGIGINWLIIDVTRPEPTPLSGDYEDMLTNAEPYASCIEFGLLFKLAILERVNLSAEETHFPIVIDALTHYYNSETAAKQALQNFQLNNQGHRAELQFAMRDYVLGVLAKTNPSTWTVAEAEVIAEYEGKIHDLRVDYGNRLAAKWAQFTTNYISSGSTSFSNLFNNLDADDFIWPSTYTSPNTFEQELMAAYITSNAQYSRTNYNLNPTATAYTTVFALPGIAYAFDVGIATGIWATNAAVNIGTTAATALSAAGGIVTVLLISAQVFAAEIQETIDFIHLENKKNEKIEWANAPVNMHGTMVSTLQLDILRIISDLEYLMVQSSNSNGYEYNTNDNGVGLVLFSCQNATVYLGPTGTASLAPNDVTYPNSVLPDCGELPVVSLSKTNFNYQDVGTPQQVTLTVTHALYNLSCNAIVTVIDNTPPVAKCKDFTTYLSVNGHAAVYGPQVNNGSFDNAGIKSLSLNVELFDCSDMGMHTATLTVKDYGNNVSTCTTQITIADNIAPTVSCNIIPVYLDANGQAVPDVSNAYTVTADNCASTYTASIPPTTFNCGDLAPQVRTLSVKDASNNAGTCSLTMVVLDTIKPVAGCKNTTIYIDQSGNATLTAADVFDASTSSDNCTVVTPYLVNQGVFVCSEIGNHSVSLQVKDGSGNIGFCNASVTVSKGVGPDLVCKNFSVLLNANGSASIHPANVFDANNSSDLCGGVTATSVTPNQFNCQHIGPNTITLTGEDDYGNPSTCTATVMVSDLTAPTVICKNKTVQLNANGQASITFANVFNAANSNDNCGTVTPSSLSKNTFDCTNLGANTVTLTANDGNGNSGTCTATVTVTDAIAPTVVCKNKTIQLDANGQASIVFADVFNAANSNDNCGTVSPSSLSKSTFNCSNVGANTITLTANDGNGNSRTCTATVTVTDAIAPTVVCKNKTVQLNANGQASITFADVFNAANSNDNCSTVSPSSLSKSTFDCSNVGANTITLTANDGHGNSGTCMATITISDNVAPTAICKAQTIQATLNANAQYTIDPNALNNGSTDACGIQTLTANPALLGCQHEGTNPVSLIVTDVNGNSANCTVFVEVAEFLTINNVANTPETCAGAGDGSIIISATTGGGQIGYSINDGATFSFNNTFSNLTSGNYNVVVKVFGVPANCEKTAVAIIGAGGNSQTWYKDMDGDGYTDGTTMSGCSAPPGYVAAAVPGDCDDNDANEFPGQIWWKDADNDGYSNGNSIVACQRPNGHKAMNELISAATDCNDNNGSVHPLATEICNGLDDDCDGEIDEETSGGLTFNGNVSLTTQAAVNAFSQCYSIINGNLTISGINVDSLDNLINLTEVTGNVFIQYTGLDDLNGLDSLTDIGGALTIFYNSTLTSLEGLDSLSTVGGNLMIYYNFQLSDCCAIYNLLDNGGVSGSIVIYLNKVGCNSVTEINNNCAPPPPLIKNPNGTSSISQAQGISLESGNSAVVDDFILFPNPTSNTFNVVIPNGIEDGKIVVMDLLGRTLLAKEIIDGHLPYTFDASHLRSGIYMITVRTKGQKLKTKRLVIE